MSWILFILFGFVIGLLARALVPGRQKLGIIWTVLLGVAGSLLGGAVGSFFSGGSVTDLSTAGFIGSLVGAVALLLVFVAVTRRRVGRYGRPPRHA